jgi:hypothetical protein
MQSFYLYRIRKLGLNFHVLCAFYLFTYLSVFSTSRKFYSTLIRTVKSTFKIHQKAHHPYIFSRYINNETRIHHVVTVLR